LLVFLCCQFSWRIKFYITAAARRSLPAVPHRIQNELSSVARHQPPRSDTGYTICGSNRPVSDEHYTIINDPLLRTQSGNCGQDYQDIDELIRPDPASDQPYLAPVEYGFAQGTCAMPYDLIDNSQVDDGHVYVFPGQPRKQQ